ncbi:MAG: hypothetical protein V4671_07185 [Armatimonadota bacterium]
MNTERTAVLADTLAGYRQNRHAIRGVEIISDCCPTCDLDSGREFALDAVPLLPHTYCTNPEGCQCCYAPIRIGADTGQEKAPPVVYPPAYEERSGGLPAYLKTPAAAMILVGVAVISAGIALINSNTNSENSAPLTQTVVGSVSGPVAPAQGTVPVRAVQRQESAPSKTRPAKQPPVFAVNYARPQDRDLERKAARDLREAEANARANESARQAQEVAVQQQAYLRTLLSQQASQNRGSAADRPRGRISAGSVVASTESTAR